MKYFVENLPEGWDKQLFEMAKEGAGPEEVLAEWGLHWDTHARFKTESSEYKEAWEMAELLRKAYFYRIGRINLTSPAKEFNLGNYAFHMKNLFQWGDTPYRSYEPPKPNKPDKLKEAEIKAQFKNEHFDTVN